MSYNKGRKYSAYGILQYILKISVVAWRKKYSIFNSGKVTVVKKFDHIDIVYSSSCREVDTYTAIVLHRGTYMLSYFVIRLPRGPYSCFLGGRQQVHLVVQVAWH